MSRARLTEAEARAMGLSAATSVKKAAVRRTVDRSHENALELVLKHTPGCGGFVREHRFHPDRKWRFDFAWPAYFVAVEVEGGAFVQGRHSRGLGMIDDAEKYNEAACAGWLVLRHVPHGQSAHEMASLVLRALHMRGLRFSS